MSETKTKNLCTVPAADLADSQYFIAENGGELQRVPKAQVVLKKLENMLATDTESLAGGGEVSAQDLLDTIADQVANKLLAKSQVVNNLLATVAGNPLDATQGKALKDQIDTTNNNLSKYWSLDGNATTIIPNNSDMNSYITPGNYRCVSNASLPTLSNCPVDNAFSLKVSTPIGSPNYIVQEYIDLAGRQAIRAYSTYEKTWTEKKSVIKDDFVIKTYTIAGKAVNAETTADFEPNIALSGYTPLGIVGTRLNSYGSVTLVYADLVDNTKARVRVRNNGTASVTGENVIIRVLYFKS